MIIHWKAVEQYFAVVLFTFGLDTVRSEKVSGNQVGVCKVNSAAHYFFFQRNCEGISQFYPVCNFRTFINFGLGTVRSERVHK